MSRLSYIFQILEEYEEHKKYLEEQEQVILKEYIYKQPTIIYD